MDELQARCIVIHLLESILETPHENSFDMVCSSVVATATLFMAAPEEMYKLFETANVLDQEASEYVKSMKATLQHVTN